MSQATATTATTVKTRATRRAPIKALAQTTEQVATAAAADKARKTESRQALARAKQIDALKALAEENYEQDGGVMSETYDAADYGRDITEHATAAKAWAFHMRIVEAQRESQAAYEVDDVTVDPVTDRAAEYAANALQAATIDAAALGVPVEQVLADMGLAEDGTPKTANKDGYSGPMLALKTARKAYIKGANGNQHCGDDIAQLFAGVKPAVAIRACITALKLDGNPYLHLNVGQQSMNLRNKLRGAIKNGTVKLSDAVSAVSTAITAIV